MDCVSDQHIPLLSSRRIALGAIEFVIIASVTKIMALDTDIIQVISVPVARQANKGETCCAAQIANIISIAEGTLSIQFSIALKAVIMAGQTYVVSFIGVFRVYIRIVLLWAGRFARLVDVKIGVGRLIARLTRKWKTCALSTPFLASQTCMG